MIGFGRRRKILRAIHEIAPDEIFLDSTNLPGRNDPQFEARVIRPVSARAIAIVGVVFAGIALLFIGRAFSLEVTRGQAFAQISRDNRLDRSLIFATRGLILDRTGKELAWNVADAQPGSASSTTPFALRAYTSLPGFSHVLGFVRYPRADASGAWWREEYAGVSGVERAFNAILVGENGSTMVETNAHGKVEQQNIVSPPRNGADLTLSIDAGVQSKLYSILSQHAQEQKFVGGGAVIMNVRTGEILALTSFPEYNNQAFTDGDAKAVATASHDPHAPLLDRVTSGLYAPGSIVKPIFAAGALNENLIDPDTQILSTGAITIPNPYDRAHPSVFRDWAVHGLVDMRTAIAVSSDEYFYTIGGGYGSQPGLGISRLDTYARLFGLGSTTGFDILGEETGVIPTPAWKEKTFGKTDPWRIGDTYHTAIGQYGFQITPLQAVRYIAAIANGGHLMTPQIVASSTPEYSDVGIPEGDLQIVREGMRLAVTSVRKDATVKVLNLSGIAIAAKTGTAQIGAHNEWMNSWSVGFWPADNPQYAYAAVLEKAPAGTASGAAPGLVPFFQWLIANHPEYLK